MQHRQQSARQGSLLVRQNTPAAPPHTPLFSVTDGLPLSHEMYCRNPRLQMYSDASNQQINTGRVKKRQRVWLKYFKYPPLFSRMVSHYRDVYTCRVCALFWQSLSPVCLLIEILIDISEGDFNHKGVVHAYLSEPQRKKRISSRLCHPSCTAASVKREMCLKTRLPFRLCNTCQTAANLTAAREQTE